MGKRASTFKVVEELPAQRCEICHKADRFDPATETCLRCQALTVAGLTGDTANRIAEPPQTPAAAAGPQRRVRMPIGELSGLVKEALQLYRGNILLMTAIYAIAELPILIGFFIVENHEGEFSPAAVKFWYLFFLFAPILFTTVSTGALVKAVLNRYNDRPASLRQCYAFVLFDLKLPYILTTIIGSAYQWLGLILFSLFFPAIETNENRLIAVVVFLAIGLYTYPRAALVAEVAVVERRNYLDALRRGSRLGAGNWLLLCLFSFLCYVVPKIIAAIVLQQLVGMGIIDATSDIIFKAANAGIEIAAYPIFFVTKTLIYFHLCMLESRVKFVARQANS